MSRKWDYPIVLHRFQENYCQRLFYMTSCYNTATRREQIATLVIKNGYKGGVDDEKNPGHG